MPLITYQHFHSKYSAAFEKYNRQLGWLSFVRLALFIGIIAFGYYYLVSDARYWLIFSFICLASFLYCLRLYDVIKARADFAKALADVNDKEILFLKERVSGYEGGSEFSDPHHPYSYDLDLFGEGSLYEFLNRTTTAAGKESLAQALLHPDTKSIQIRQEAIRELRDKIDFRQHIQASGSIHATEPADLDKLKNWIRTEPVFKTPVPYYALLLFPVATLTILLAYFFTESDRLLNVFFGLLALNLLVTFSFARKMMKQMSVSSAVTKVLQQFAEQLKEIEKQAFHSPLLQQFQDRLKQDGISASRAIQKLASLFKYLDFILNLAVSIVLNGLFLFHVHILYALDRWKKKYASEVEEWLQVIGELESLHSFAGFSFNNSAFCFPRITGEETFSAAEMGHPLIRTEKRITNDVSFHPAKFIVLTGSNMSGKSTFLRTLGVNLVLARAGSVVCAKEFELFPYDLHVSMRITDSLQDSESLFYAELKRLQGIIEHLRSEVRTFVILDEILRGTNSNDKHNGTVGLIRKLAAYKCCGIIATHDLTIAGMSAEYPGYMGNKCFESVIANDELIFDYKLKEGVCSKLNASFLMKRMGIIN